MLGFIAIPLLMPPSAYAQNDPVSVLAAILFFYVFGLAAILMTYLVINTVYRYGQERKKEQQKNTSRKEQS